MKKFEEELKDNNLEILVSNTGSSLCGRSYLNYDAVVELSKGWVSPEDHQAEIGKIELQNLKYREEIARMQKSLRKKNKAIKELNGAVKKSKARLKECEKLRIEANNEAASEYSRKCEVVEERAEFKREIEKLKSQLEKQQPEIPEVPQFVADWYEENKGSLDYMIFETCRDLTDESTNEFENWFGYDENKAITTLVNMKNGYTVAKEKRFYLKHIDMSKKYNSTVCVLAHGEGDVIYGHYEFPVGVSPSESEYIFTQSEIDSMETGSYEQIEVEE